MTRRPALALIALLAVLPLPALATSVDLQPEEELLNLPTGRLPVRPGDARPAEVAAPLAPPAFALTPPAEPAVPTDGLFRPEVFTLPNGLAVIVIPNRRAPIVTHMVWYMVGAADEPEGKSGLAHLFEHLMFKGTAAVPDGEFSRTIASNGGQDNAFTSWDYTAYFQSIARDKLELVMQMEADRMAGLTLSVDQVNSEQKVVLAERQQTSENDPIDRLREAVRTALFVHHPYGRPIIGWPQEIGALTREDALAFYKTWYSPANAIVVVSGDVTAEELQPIAARTYGAIPARMTPARQRVVEPTVGVERRIVLRDAGTSQPIMLRSYIAPSYRAGQKELAVPLQVLAEVMGGGPTSRLYRRLVQDLRVATSVRFDYDPVAFDLSTVNLAATPAPGRDTSLLEMATDATVRDLLTNGISEAELLRAKKRLLDSITFARDSVDTPAYIFGMTLAAGADISSVEDWPQRVMAVKAEDVIKAARAIFEQKGFVTGILLPPEADSAAPVAAPALAPAALAPGAVNEVQ